MHERINGNSEKRKKKRWEIRKRVYSVCVQAVQLILDQCGGVAMSELEADESSCRAAGETPGNQK